MTILEKKDELLNSFIKQSTSIRSLNWNKLKYNKVLCILKEYSVLIKLEKVKKLGLSFTTRKFIFIYLNHKMSLALKIKRFYCEELIKHNHYHL